MARVDAVERVTPPAPRAALSDLPDGFRLVVPAKRDRGTVVYLVAFLTVWFEGGVIAFVTALPNAPVRSTSPTSPVGILLVWGLLAIVFVAPATLALRRMFIGVETATFTRAALTLEQRVGRRARARAFALADLSNLRYSPALLDPFNPASLLVQLGIAPLGTLAFDYGARAYYFADRLDVAEARAVLLAMAQRIEHLAADDPPWRQLLDGGPPVAWVGAGSAGDERR